MLRRWIIRTLGTAAATWAALVPPLDNYPPGPLVVLTLFTIFAAVWAFRHFLKPILLPPPAGAAPAEPHAHPPGAFGHGHVH